MNDMLSGTRTTYYEINGSEPTQLSPNGTQIAFAETGNYTVKYFSLDNAGNAESVKTTSNPVLIDSISPVITVDSPSESFISPFEPLTFNFTATDEHSRIREIHAYLDGVEVSNGEAIDLPDDFKYYNFTVIAIDNVGNAAEYSLNFSTGLILRGEEQFKVTPEVLRVNPGVLTAHVNFPAPFNSSTIVSATLDGAPFDQITGDGVKFRREDVEAYLQSVNNTLDTHFKIFGQFSYNEQLVYFLGEDDISEVQSE